MGSDLYFLSYFIICQPAKLAILIDIACIKRNSMFNSTNYRPVSPMKIIYYQYLLHRFHTIEDFKFQFTRFYFGHCIQLVRRLCNRSVTRQMNSISDNKIKYK